MKFLSFFVPFFFSYLFSISQTFGPGSGNTLVFDGVSTRVNIPDSPSFTHGNNITLEAWIFPTTYGGVIFGKHHTVGTREYTIQLLQDGRIRFDVFDNSSTDYLTYSLTTVPLNTWTHVAGTYSYSSGISQIYINGVLDQTTVIGSVIIASTTIPPLIGAYWLAPPTDSKHILPALSMKSGCGIPSDPKPKSGTICAGRWSPLNPILLPITGWMKRTD